MKERIVNLYSGIKNWVRENKLEAVLLSLIILTGAFLRLYKISEYMTFLGDEGRDALIVRRFITEGDIMLVGPGTSIGDMYLGPLYYYMMAPALLLAGFSPVGPAVQIALLGVVTIFFVWWVAREWFSKKEKKTAKFSVAALMAAGLYAISPIVIIYSRSSWNPNIMPFFALLSVYSIWRVWQFKEYKWLLVLGVSFAFVLQSHYLGLLLVPTLGLFWLLTIKDLRAKKRQRRKFLKYSVFSLLFFVALMSPLIIFDARHGWRNFYSMKKFFTERQTTVSAKPWSAFPKLIPLSEKITTRLLAGEDKTAGKWILRIISVGIFWVGLSFRKHFNKRQKSAFLFLGVWLAFSLIGLGVYKQEIYDHYFGFFFPVPFLLVGGIAENLFYKYKTPGKLLVFAVFLFLVVVSLKNNPLKYPPNRQLQRSQQVAQKIIGEAGEKKFNLAVIAERNYEGAYQYFLEKEGAPIVMIDPQKAEETIAEQLFVVCELPREKCDPVNNPKAEVANFGWSKIEKVWEVAGTTVFKLVHLQ